MPITRRNVRGRIRLLGRAADLRAAEIDQALREVIAFLRGQPPEESRSERVRVASPRKARDSRRPKRRPVPATR
jgi:hypothetical protein